MVIDTDGSAFITKAEFDSLKNNFQAQIDNYNNSIDSKIDGAIAAYLAGVKVATAPNYYTLPTESYYFINDLNESELGPDEGMMSLSQIRIARCNALKSVSVSSSTWGHPPQRWLILPCQTGGSKLYNAWLASNPTWSSSRGTTQGNWSIDFGSNYASIGLNPSAAAASGASLKSELESIALASMGSGTEMSMGYWPFVAGFNWTTKYVKDGVTSLKIYSYNGVSWDAPPTKGVLTGSTSPTPGAESACGLYSLNDDNTFGVGYGVSRVGGYIYLKQKYKKISVYNIIDSQVYTYQDHSDNTYHHSDTAWNDDGGGVEVNIEPAATWDPQEQNPTISLTESGTTNKFHTSFRATKITEVDPLGWSSTHQIGIKTHIGSMTCFDESCDLQVGASHDIVSPTNDFNRVGYYLDSSDNLVTKPDCVVKTGKLTYKKLFWGSEELEPETIVQESLTNKCGEVTYLGGGVPLCQTPTETTGTKVKLHYKVTKLDGTPIDSAAGDIPIKITLSNKQFVNGNLAGGAANRGEFTTTVNSSSPEGDWESNTFMMEIKEKLWLNAYASTKGYNVVINNIDVS